MKRSKNVLSIQSWVSYGHVGNAAALFALQRLGVNASGVHTVQFSNHTGYGAWRGEVFDAALIGELVAGIDERGALERMDGVLSGYMGSAATVAQVTAAVRLVKKKNPKALYCLDPVMGDFGRGVFVHPDLPAVIENEAVPSADVLVPNHFELQLLSGKEISTMGEAIEAAQLLRGRMNQAGPRLLVVTSLERKDAPADRIETLVVSDEGAWHCSTPKLPLDPPRNGTGDLIAALFFAHVLSEKSPAEALSLATSALYSVLKRTHESGSREIELIASQDELMKPAEIFEASSI